MAITSLQKPAHRIQSYKRTLQKRRKKSTVSFVVPNLAPGTKYSFEVVAYKGQYLGPSTKVSGSTKSKPLPIVPGLKAEVLKLHGTSVKVYWDHPKDSRKESWVYGIYYAFNMKDLLHGPKDTTTNLTFTVKHLEACESYLFDVALVGPLGHGPLTGEPVNLITQFNKQAPPKSLQVVRDPRNETLMIVSWASSCLSMSDKIGYRITITELNLQKSYHVTLLPTTETQLKQEFEAHFGGHYRVVVQTSVNDSIPSKPVEYWAAPIPPPHQVQVLPEKNGSYFVYWKDQELPEQVQKTKHWYEVLVSEGNSLNRTSAKKYETQTAPFVLNEIQEGYAYTIGVTLHTENGYHSTVSELSTVEMPKGNWAAVISTSNLVSVAVPVVLVIIVLIGALAFFIFRHRRLQRSFVSFANSHYDTRSGAATFSGGEGLDEEDSPVIRGFSDDEPLVIA